MSGGGGGSSSSDAVLQRQESEARAAKANREAFIRQLNTYFGVGAPQVAPQNEPGVVYYEDLDPKFAEFVQSRGGTLFPGVQYKNRPAPTSTGNAYADNLNSVRDRIASNVRAFHQQDLDEQYGTNRRELKFELSRRGQLGGSDDIDQNSELRRLYQKGTVRVGNLGNQARQDAIARDEQTRLNAIRDINADIEGGSVIQSALSQQALNANAASDYAQGQALGDQFANLSYLYGVKRNADTSRQLLNRYNSARSSGASTPNYGTVSQ